MATAPAPAAAPQTRAEPVSAPHDVPHLTTSEPDTRSSVVRPPEHARADDAAVPTGAGGRPRAPPISRRRRVSYASPPRDRAMLRRGSPPCDACAASPRRGRPIVLLNHATLRLRAPPERRFRPFFWLTTEHEPCYTRTPRRVRQHQPYAEKKAISRLAPGEQSAPASISSMLYTGTEVPNRGGTGNGKAANGWEDGGMGGRSRWGNCSL